MPQRTIPSLDLSHDTGGVLWRRSLPPSRPDVDLSVRDRFVDPDPDPKDPPITAGRFLRQRLEEIGLVA